MKIIISIEHPAWAHQFKYLISELEKKGHYIKVVAIKKDCDLELLDAFGIGYELISKSSGKNIFEKGFIFLFTTWRIFNISLKYKPDLFLGRASPMMAINSWLFRKPHIVFEDTEHSGFCLSMVKLFSTVIYTPEHFKKDLGKKHQRVKAFKELFYLHPNYFKPSLTKLSEIG
jgi:predicted glycosyltransferase